MKYQATAPVTLPVGAAVKLTAAQARRCRHLAKPAANGWSETIVEIQFKTGEEFETGLAMSKANTVALEAPQGAETAAAPEAKSAPAKAAAKR